MEGDAPPAATAALLTALRVRGERVPEIVGFARAMRRFAARVEAPEGVVDTCGTGGDAKGTINVSTAAAFVARGAGVRSEEHTSELQSRQYLVCRLLLEKKEEEVEAPAAGHMYARLWTLELPVGH